MALTLLFILLTVFGSGRSEDGLGKNINVTSPGGPSLQESEWSADNLAINCTPGAHTEIPERGKIVKRCAILRELCNKRCKGTDDGMGCMCPSFSTRPKSLGSTTKTIGPNTTDFGSALAKFSNGITKSRKNIKNKFNSLRQNKSEPAIIDKGVKTGLKSDKYNQSEISTDDKKTKVNQNVSFGELADDSLNVYKENQANEIEIPKKKREDSDEKNDFISTSGKRVINVNYDEVDFNKDINKTGWDQHSRNNFSDVDKATDKHHKVYVLVAGNLDVNVDINNAFFDGNKSLGDDSKASLSNEKDEGRTIEALSLHEAYNAYNKNNSSETKSREADDEDISKLWDEVMNSDLENISKMNKHRTTFDDNNYNGNNGNFRTASNFNSPQNPPIESKATNGYLWSENKRDRESSVNLPSTKQVKQSYASRDGDYQVSKEDVSGSKEVNYWQTKTESTFSCDPQPRNYEIRYSDNESIDNKNTLPDRKEDHEFVDGQFIKVNKKSDEDNVKVTDNVNLESSRYVNEYDKEEDYPIETDDDPDEDDQSNFRNGIRNDEEAERQSNYEYRSRSTSDQTNGRNDRLMGQVAPQFLPNAQPYVPPITFKAYDKFHRGSNVNNYPIMRIYYLNKHRWDSIPVYHNNMYEPPRQRCPNNYRYY